MDWSGEKEQGELAWEEAEEEMERGDWGGDGNPCEIAPWVGTVRAGTPWDGTAWDR